MTPTRISPARAHQQYVAAQAGPPIRAADGTVIGYRAASASSPGSSANGSGTEGPEAGDREASLMALQLIDHRASLKALQSRERKIALKRELVPLYDAWIAGVLAGNSGQPDVVFTTILIWKLDIGAYEQALPMIDYVLRHQLALPDHITRSPACFFTEEIAEAALKALGQGGETAAAFPISILAELESRIEDEDPDQRPDMPDEVRAKLQKALARAILRDDDDSVARLDEALARFQRALELDPGAGVKKEIEQLTRKVSQARSAQADTEPPSAAEVNPVLEAEAEQTPSASTEEG